jgi:hypothetical protein
MHISSKDCETRVKIEGIVYLHKPVSDNEAIDGKIINIP